MNCLAVVAVDVADHVPAVRFEAFGRVISEPSLDMPIDGDAVVIVQRNEFAETERSSQRARLMRNAFHHAAVAEERVGVVRYELDAGPVELPRQQLLRDRHADGVGDALPERSGRGLHAGRDAILRVPGGCRMQLAEAPELRQRQVIAAQVQQCVQQHRAVAVRDHEAVPVRPLRIRRVVPQVTPPQHLRDFGHAHRHAGMAGIRLLDRIHRQSAQRIDGITARRRRDRGLNSRCGAHVAISSSLRSAAE